MEIISNNTEQQTRKKRPDAARSRNLYLGGTLIAAGVLWMCYNLDLVNAKFFDRVFSWQVLLIAVGGYLISVRKWAAGSVVAGIGAVFAVIDWFDIQIPVGKVILPVLVIGIGIAIIFQNKS